MVAVPKRKMVTPKGKKGGQTPAKTPGSMKKKNKSPGITPASMKKKNQSPGKTPESLKNIKKKGKHAKKLIEAALQDNQAGSTQTPSKKKKKPATQTSQSAGGDTVTPQKLSRSQTKELRRKLYKAGRKSPVVTQKAAKRKLGDGEGEGAPAAKKGSKKLKAKSNSAETLEITASQSKKMRRISNKLRLKSEENLCRNRFALIFKNHQISLKGAINKRLMKLLKRAEDIIVIKRLEVVCQDEEKCMQLKAEINAVPQINKFTVEPVYSIERKKTRKPINVVYAIDIGDAKIPDLAESFPKGIKYNIFQMLVDGNTIRIGKVKYDFMKDTQEVLAKKMVQLYGKQVLLVNGRSAIKGVMKQQLEEKELKKSRSIADKKARIEKEGKKKMKVKKGKKIKKTVDKATNGMVKTAVENGTAEEEVKPAEDKEESDEVSDKREEEEEKDDDELDEEEDEEEEEGEDDDENE